MIRVHRARTLPGFTVIEVMVAVIVLTIIAAALGRVTRQVGAVSRRAQRELGATAFLMTEAARLRGAPWNELTDGSHTRGDSVASWTVSTAGHVRRIVLITGYTSRVTGSFVAWDTAIVVRRSPP